MGSFLDPAVLSAIVLAVLGLIGTYVTNRQNKIGAKATNALNERTVDREEWREYVDRQDTERLRLEKRIEDLETRLEAEVAARKKAEDRAEAADLRAERAEKRAEALGRRVTQLEETLRKHGIPVPPPTDLPDDYP